jgi:chromosomal replication initiation ATPase DnaA
MSIAEFTEEDIERQSSLRVQVAGFIRRIMEREEAESLARRIALRHGLTLTDVLSPCRLAHLVRARRDIAKVLRLQGWSYQAIGAFLERDHATIMALVKGRKR